MSTIEIEGAFTDSLSGVIEAELHHDSYIIPLNSPFLPVSRSLDTIIPSGNPWQTNEFKLIATDRAGNSWQENFSVRYTLGQLCLLQIQQNRDYRQFANLDRSGDHPF